MDRSLARYIWKHTWRQQVWILCIVGLSMIPYFMSFDLPKQIVNGPIQGDGFDGPDAVQPFLALSLDLPFVGTADLFSGFMLTREQMLYALSFFFLFLVVVNGLFKFYINTYKGRLGERMLRRTRFELVDRVLRFPPFQFKRVKAAEVATMVKDEVEPLGGFIGDAFVQPALLGGQAITAMVFIMVQNVWLGLIAAVVVGVQLAIIPRMRRRLLVLGRERQLTARQLSGRVGEIVDGIGAIHINDTSNYERADIAARLGRIFQIRYDLYQWKFMVKFINNFLAQVTPFLFYMIGGYLALRGRLDVGQLVAVIAAYKDLPGPLKELIDWDQIRQDVQIKYSQVVEQFSIDRVLDPKLQAIDDKPSVRLEGPLSAVNLSLADDTGAALVQHVSFSVEPGEAVALVSTSTGGAEALAEAVARLNWPESGKLMAGDRDLLELPESVVGRRISYASSDAHLFSGTIRDNLLYGLKHAPLRVAQYDGDLARKRSWEVSEARKAGNPEYDINSDWIDYESAGAKGPDDLYSAIRPILDSVILTRDILELGLRSSLVPAEHPELVSRIVEVREGLRERLEADGMSDVIVPFEPGSYNSEATVGENLLFGTTGAELSGPALAANPYFQQVLEASGLDRDLYGMGLEIAAHAIELFADLPPDHPFFQQLDFMTADQIPLYQSLLQKLKGKPYEQATPEERVQIISLSFAYVEPKHRFGLLTDALKARIVEARTRFYEGLPDALRASFEPYDPERYMAAATVIDNMLFGRIAHNHPDAPEHIRTVVRDLLEDLDLFDDVLSVGLGFDVGVAGKRLTRQQRQKLDIARALLKRADFLVLNRPLSALEQRVQDQILRNVLEEARREPYDPAILWVLSNPALSNYFDRVLVFDEGTLHGDGTHETLAAGNGIFTALLSQ
ncbi:MAG: ABC transporter ATP-binding protein [Rhizobiaceae bacterium]|nr:ABC transporter ATP-binding protein [Rhizobiaceae bacterium]